MRLRRKARQASSIVTSDTVQHRGGRKSLIAVIAVLFIFLVIAGIETVAIVRHRLEHSPSHTATSTSTSYLASHPSQQIQAAQTELQKANTPRAKSVAYEDLGTAYMNNKQGNQAIAAYQQALSADSSNQQAVLAELASAYIQLGQTQQAINTLQKVVAILRQSKDPNAPTLIPRYELLIQQLQQGVIS